MLGGHPKSDILCAIWELILVEMTQFEQLSLINDVIRGPLTSLIHLRKVMHHFSSNPYLFLWSIIPFWVSETVPQICIFCTNWELILTKWHRVSYTGSIDAIRGSSYLSYTSQEEFEPLQQQWMSLLVVPHPISCAESVCNVLSQFYVHHEFKKCP